jgi:hypothetical protein
MAKTPQTKPETDASRRNFLKLAGTAPVAAAAVTLTGTAAQAEAEPKSSGLQDTAHTRAYLATARF